MRDGRDGRENYVMHEPKAEGPNTSVLRPLPIPTIQHSQCRLTCRAKPLPNSPAQAPALLSQSDRQAYPSRPLDRIEPVC
jgi:hypothetical protein